MFTKARFRSSSLEEMIEPISSVQGIGAYRSSRSSSSSSLFRLEACRCVIG